ncbi:MAG: hypothetical protein LBT32_03025 [Peptococcaceae bacterium]|jgi:hypothetical protein|nr:hypothetical protein [Peptococcaceae bacterium]
MILTTMTVIAVQCAHCGELDYQALSLFAFNRQMRVRYHCRCKVPLLSFATRDRRQFQLAYACGVCGQTHHASFKRKELWGEQVQHLHCPVFETPVGFIGPRKQVMQAGRENDRSINGAADLGDVTEYENPALMLRVLRHLRFLVKRHALGCMCGSRQLVFDLRFDRVELYCESCEALGIVRTDHAEDICQIESMKSLYLKKNKTWQINC